jgi:hypothetical protein
MHHDEFVNELETTLANIRAGNSNADARLEDLLQNGPSISLRDIDQSKAVAIGRDIKIIINEQLLPQDLILNLQRILELLLKRLSSEGPVQSVESPYKDGISRIRVFVSYKHSNYDQEILDELLEYMAGAVQDAGGEFWEDRQIKLGDLWDSEIRTSLDKSKIALVLVSQQYLTSEYIRKVELSNFISRRKHEGLYILPIILSPCRWKDFEWLRDTQFLPTNGETLAEHYVDYGKRLRLYSLILEHLLGRIASLKSNPETLQSKPDSTDLRNWNLIFNQSTLQIRLNMLAELQQRGKSDALAVDLARDKAFNEENMSLKVRAIYVFAHLAPDEFKISLANLLQNLDPIIRLHALAAALEVKCVDELIVEQAIEDPNLGVQTIALRAIAALQLHMLTAEVIKKLEYDDPEVVSTAIQTLETLNSPQAVAAVALQKQRAK